MASSDATTSTHAEEAQSQDLAFELRRVLSNSYAFVLGEQATQSFSALTYEELADDQIERIEGKDVVPGRPNELERVDRLQRELTDAIQKIKQIPPEKFIESDSRRDVNTPVEPAED